MATEETVIVEKVTEPTEPKPVAPTYTDEQQRDIDRRMAATRKQAEADARAKFEQTATEKAEAEKVERERKEAEARGEFDSVKTSLETEAKTHKERADAAEAKATQYESLITPIVTERLETLKAASADVAKGFPADAPVLDQLAWLDDPRTKALIATQDSQNQKYLGHVNTPKPNANLTDAQRADAERQRLQQSGKYSI